MRNGLPPLVPYHYRGNGPFDGEPNTRTPKLAEHGTPTRYRQHKKSGEKPCRECSKAFLEHQYAHPRKDTSRGNRHADPQA